MPAGEIDLNLDAIHCRVDRKCHRHCQFVGKSGEKSLAHSRFAQPRPPELFWTVWPKFTMRCSRGCITPRQQLSMNLGCVGQTQGRFGATAASRPKLEHGTGMAREPAGQKACATGSCGFRALSPISTETEKRQRTVHPPQCYAGRAAVQDATARSTGSWSQCVRPNERRLLFLRRSYRGGIGISGVAVAVAGPDAIIVKLVRLQ